MPLVSQRTNLPRLRTLRSSVPRRQPIDRARSLSHPTLPEERTRIARNLHGGAGILALAVLADSGLEHYRGLFFNRAMFIPLGVSTLSLAASLHGLLDSRPLPHGVRDAVYGTAAATGVIGTGFHTWNVGKRTGGFSFLNFFYGAPIGAPMALLLTGLIGLGAERVRERSAERRLRILGLPAGRLLAGVTATGLLGTSAEAALLHFRGAYHNPAMYAPVSLPPVAAGLLAGAASQPRNPRRMRLARSWLRLVTALGFVGVGFHALGIHRNMGGWRNWSQNILNGPPLPAPPSFTGLALAGLAALDLLREAWREGGSDP